MTMTDYYILNSIFKCMWYFGSLDRSCSSI